MISEYHRRLLRWYFRGKLTRPRWPATAAGWRQIRARLDDAAFDREVERWEQMLPPITTAQYEALHGDICRHIAERMPLWIGPYGAEAHFSAEVYIELDDMLHRQHDRYGWGRRVAAHASAILHWRFDTALVDFGPARPTVRRNADEVVVCKPVGGRGTNPIVDDDSRAPVTAGL